MSAIQEEENPGGSGGREGGFGLGEECETEKESGDGGPKGRCAAGGRIEVKEREESEKKAPGKFVGVGGEIILVADAGVAVEGKEEDEGADGKSGDCGAGKAAENCPEGEEGGNPEGEVEGEQRMDGGAAEEGEECGIGIDGEGAEIVGEVAVEDIAARDAPRKVEFSGEVDEVVGPGEPGGMEHEGREGGIEEKFEGKTAPGRER